MKKQIRLLALIALVLAAIMVLVSCGGDNTPEETKKQEETKGQETEKQTEPGETQPAETQPGETEPGETQPGETEPGETEPAESKEPKKEGDMCHVRFLGFNDDVLKEQDVKYGGRANAPRVPVPEGWKWTQEWDHTFREIYDDVDIRAIFKQLEEFTVAFQAADGSEIASFKVFEEKALDTANVPAAPQTLGTYFVGWGLVEDGKAPTTTSTAYKRVTGNQTYQPVYASTTAIAPFVTDAITLDGDMDEAYQKYSKNADGSYANVFHLFSDPDFDLKDTWPDATGYTKSSFWTDPADPEGKRMKYTENTMDAYVIWNGDYVYILVEVTDKSLGGRSYAYINNTANAYLNDTVELWYNFEKVWTSTQNKLKVGIDAMGIRHFGDPTIMKGADPHTMSSWFEQIEVKTKVLLKSGDWVNIAYKNSAWTRTDTGATVTKDDLGDKYRAEFKIPARTEAPEGDPDPTAGKELKGWTTLSAHDVLHMCLQNNDVQAWDTAETDKGEATPDADYFKNNFTANGRTQYWYPAYDTISLAGEGETVTK